MEGRGQGLKDRKGHLWFQGCIWVFSPCPPRCHSSVRSKSLRCPSQTPLPWGEGISQLKACPSVCRPGSSESLHVAVRGPPCPTAHPCVGCRSPSHLPCHAQPVTDGVHTLWASLGGMLALLILSYVALDGHFTPPRLSPPAQCGDTGP